MAEKRRSTGEKKSGLLGRLAVTPTRTSPRNKLNAAAGKEDGVTDSAKAKKLVQTRLNFSKATPKQIVVEEKAVAESPVEDPPKKKRGRKPGPKKAEPEKPKKIPPPVKSVDDIISEINKQKKSKVNGSEESPNATKSDQSPIPKQGRGLGKRKSSVKEAEISISSEDLSESSGSPHLTYPGDLKCEACQRTFSNSSGFKRHLKYCMDAEGPPVFWKLKKQGPNNQSSLNVNGNLFKESLRTYNRISKDGKGKAAKGRREQTPVHEMSSQSEVETGRKVTRQTPQKDKQAEHTNLEENERDTETDNPTKEARKNARGKAAGKKAEEEQKRRGRKGESGKITEYMKGNMDASKTRNTKANYEEKVTGNDSTLRGDSSINDDDLDAGDSSMYSSEAGAYDPDMEIDDPDNHTSSRAEKSLREKMKGVMLSKVNELIDETSATAPGKCHCCGEDLETAHLGGEHECDDCGKHFKLRASLDRHRRVIHMQGETHACPECDARCPDKGSLARHMYTHTGLKPYSCERCKKEFSRKYHLERHVIQTGCDGNPKPTYPCQVCGRMFSRKDNLREHLRAHAGQVKRKKKYSCEYCLKEFHGTSLLRIHVRTHTGERPFECDFCQKGFPSSGAMKKHRRMHTGERPYECKDCFAKFSAKETLNRHARTHTGLKPHVCNYCGKSFIQAAQLRAHIFHHTAKEAEGENGFTCDHCGKAFNRRARLHMHVKYVHEGARPYECSNCGKTFVRKEDLVRHTVLHSGVKAHKCPICEKSFAMKSSLKIHLLTHTKEPPRSCDECGRAFIRQDCLLRHMRSKHREMLEEILAEAEKKKLQQQLLAATASAAMTNRMVGRGERGRMGWGSSRDGHPEDELEEDDDMDDVPEAGAIGRVLGLTDSAKAGALLQHLTSMGESAGNSPMPRMETAASSSAALSGIGTTIPSSSRRQVEMIQGGGLSESALADSVRELLTLLVDDATLRAFGWPDAPVDKLLEAVIRRCGHQPASPEDYSRPSDRLRENAKLLFTVVIDDSAVKTLLNNQTVDEVILHVLRLAKS